MRSKEPVEAYPLPAVVESDPADEEYAPLDLGGVAGLLSMGLFAAAVGARYLVAWLAPLAGPVGWRTRVLGPAVAVPALALAGLVAGLLARRRDPTAVARLGVFLNAAALLLGLLLLAAIFWILPE